MQLFHFKLNIVQCIFFLRFITSYLVSTHCMVRADETLPKIDNIIATSGGDEAYIKSQRNLIVQPIKSMYDGGYFQIKSALNDDEGLEYCLTPRKWGIWENNFLALYKCESHPKQQWRFGAYGELMSRQSNDMCIKRHLTSLRLAKCTNPESLKFNWLYNAIDGSIRSVKNALLAFTINPSMLLKGQSVMLSNREIGGATHQEWILEPEPSWFLMGSFEREESNNPQGSVVSLSEDGTVALVGVRKNNTAWVYERAAGSNSWYTVGEALTGPANFGTSTAISNDGTIIAVGSATANNVKIFEWDSNLWNPIGDLSGGNRFGASVDLSGTGERVAIGVEGQGSIYVYDRLANSTWVLAGEPISSTSHYGDNFGFTVSISEDGTTVVGASRGYAYAYGSEVYFAEVWRVNKYQKSWWRRGPRIQYYSIDSVSLNGDGNGLALATACPSDSKWCPSEYQEDGRVDVYSWNEEMKYYEKLGNSIKGNKDGAGSSIDLSRDGMVIAVGSYLSKSGARVFEWDGSDWVQRGMNSPATNEVGNTVALSRDGSTWAIGISGSALVYDWN